MDVIAQIATLADRVATLARDAARPDVDSALRRLAAAAETVGQAWCGSWLPGMANLYEASLQPMVQQRRAGAAVPTSTRPTGRCTEWAPQAIRAAVHHLAGSPDVAPLLRHATVMATQFDDVLLESRVWLAAACAEFGPDERLQALAADAAQLQLTDADTLVDSWRPRVKRLGRDSVVPGAEQVVPAHFSELAAVQALRSPLLGLKALAVVLQQAQQQLEALGAVHDDAVAVDPALLAALPVAQAQRLHRSH